MRSSRCARPSAPTRTTSPMRASYYGVLRLREGGPEGGPESDGDRVVQPPVGGEDLAGVAAEGLAAIAGDAPARLDDEERAGGHVPRLDLELPIAVHPAGGDEAQIERGGADAT